MKANLFLAILNALATSASQFVSRNDLKFELNDAAFTFAGANSWDIGFYDKQHITNTLHNAKNVGLPVLRIAAWNMKDMSHGLNPGDVFFEEWHGDHSTINTGANGLQILDSAVKQAEEQGIKYIVCLSNNWGDYGGMPAYVRNMVGDGRSPSNFYTDDKIVNKFKDYVTAIVKRYKDSPAIFSWELANEARCEGSKCSGTSVLTHWASTISSHIKSLDSNHLVTFGGYGYMDLGNGAHDWDFNYDGQSGESFTAILSLPTIDFGTVHLYTNDDSTKSGPKYGLQWLKDHNAAAMKVGKPVIVEELGVNRSSPEISQKDVVKSYEGYMASGEAKAIQGAMLWSCDVRSGGRKCPDPDGDGDPYAVCKGNEDYDELVPGFAKVMGEKAKANGE